MSACPFSKPIDESEGGCPFGSSPPSSMNSSSSSSGGLGEQMAKCTTYQSGGCPIDNKAKDDIEDLLSVQTPRNLSLNGKVLDRFLPEAYPIKINKAQLNQDILDDPQLAMAMRQGTKVVHSAAENSVFTRRFLKGDITKGEYGQYLRSLYFIYKSMEELLEKHQQDPAIEMIYFPDELNREQALLEDLTYFYGRERLAQVTHPDTMTPAVKRYIQAMEEACKVNPALMVSHSYARYLGDLSGGQILAKRLKKYILHLEKQDSSWDSRLGVSFYYFNNIGNQNEFKNMYRQQLDEAPVTARTKDMVVAEAVRCFELNIALFDEIQALSDANELISIDDNNKKNRWSLHNISTSLAITTIVSLGCIAYIRHRS
ncbi:heme oxygenase-domain-containing protein [Halteromyces radiatus]|uniref:heme oxygenase-domain-containing protein n=1 Tax=Halteromyces radiatus TaxID=101107 RepID=UPI00221EB42E|nr:heme oxygenase-domain-containing protein [Halteromyces radiatus]KAI8097634.1 heme oxygenase-domain-containing protein [Halteromyces radiatus]